MSFGRPRRVWVRSSEVRVMPDRKQRRQQNDSCCVEVPIQRLLAVAASESWRRPCSFPYEEVGRKFALIFFLIQGFLKPFPVSVNYRQYLRVVKAALSSDWPAGDDGFLFSHHLAQQWLQLCRHNIQQVVAVLDTLLFNNFNSQVVGCSLSCLTLSHKLALKNISVMF